MIYEDDGAEELVLAGDFDIAIPFSVSLNDGDAEPLIRVFPTQRKYADEFLRLFGDSGEHIFSEEAIKWAKRKFSRFLCENGFELCDENNGYFENFRLTKPDRSLILPSTVCITGAEGLENLTTYDFGALNSYGHLCVGTVIDGKIVSAACTNYSCALVDEDSDDREIEIGVETAAEYQRKGYGASSVAALTYALIDRDYTVLYECESCNGASAGLIAKLGGERFARNYCVVGRKD